MASVPAFLVPECINVLFTSPGYIQTSISHPSISKHLYRTQIYPNLHISPGHPEISKPLCYIHPWIHGSRLQYFNIQNQISHCIFRRAKQKGLNKAKQQPVLTSVQLWSRFLAWQGCVGQPAPGLGKKSRGKKGSWSRARSAGRK